MRPIAIVLVVAALAAGLTAFLAKSWLDRQSAGPAAQAQAAMAEVLVAAREISPGTVLGADDLRYESWPSTAVTPRLMIRRDGDDPKAQALGLVARRALAEGEPFAIAATFRQDSAGVLAGVLTPGMRAVSVAITNASAVSGFITPGDKVDVVLSTDMQRVMEGGDREPAGTLLIQRYAAETVLADVRVLAIDQQITRGRDGAAIQGKTATIEVTPKQAEILTAAGMVGTLNLVLRGLPAAGGAAVAETEADAAGFTSDTETSRALQALLGARTRPAKPSGGGGGGIQVNRAGIVTSEGAAR
ncbi:Flp pilus assembly protein CpaB [Magnetospirillum sp. SS-4]|uniref:Flp pilus assembly protein CpaB n=1 Tax=Magnetospirillum sp. SS-4 TaxID=2681465 RepID=UPI00137D2F9A|nr:Flp pilus assembly protein CpaB [Magnetospirillum sp. SS-4]CAA7616837.1 Flp pilus assembly protein CpaB [Magnetospirillum sp. SS-4]